MKKYYVILITTIFALSGFGIVSCSEGDSSSVSLDSGSAGKGGSMARFTISGDYLYTVDNQTLKTIKVSNPAQPEYLDRDQYMATDIETIFSLDGKLFIGSRSGMYIYDIAVSGFPQLLSVVGHITSCDPVVSDGQYAYVTLNTESTQCSRGVNVLQIYDVSDPKQPMIVFQLDMSNPRGLGVDSEYKKLFVCDRGLKVFDITDPVQPVWIDDLEEIEEAKGIDAYDVIPMDGKLLLIGADGLYQFDYTGERLAFISKIDLRKEIRR